MDHYEEWLDAVWEELEGKKSKPSPRLSDEERLKEFVVQYGRSGYVIQSEFGIIDTSENAMEDVVNGENLTYDEYMQAMFNSRNNQRNCSYFSPGLRGRVTPWGLPPHFLPEA